MADVSYSVSLRVDKDNLVNSVSINQTTASMQQAGYKSVVYDLTTTATSISTANLSSVGMALLRNLATSSASTAQVGFSSGGSFLAFATLRGGEPAVLRLASGVDYEARGVDGTRLRVDISEG